MNKIIPYLKSASALPGCRLFVEFEDGITGIIDLSSWKNKQAFIEWADENNFSNFIITANKKIEWSNDIDMDPDAFYLQLIGKTFEEYAGNKQLLWNTH